MQGPVMRSQINTATFPGVKKMNIGVLAPHRIKELAFFSKKTRNRNMDNLVSASS